MRRRPASARGAGWAPAAAAACLAAALALAVPAQAAPSAGANSAGLRLLGLSVGLSGTTAVASAPGTPRTRGAVLVEVRSGASWHRQATLTDPDPGQGLGFGDSTALADTTRAGSATLLISNPQYGNTSGAVYVYVRAHGSWRRQARITDPAGAQGDYFGDRVALSGNTALIGADGSGNFAGAAYVYVRSGTSWHLQATLIDPGNRAGDGFGQAVTVSGKTAVVARGATSGHAIFVFVRTGSAWHLQASLALGRAGALVTDLALSGATLVVGGPGSNFAVGGRAFVYARSGTTWRRQATLADPRRASDEFFGSAVAISPTATGVRLLVGNPDAGANKCGKAYDFARLRSGWRLKAVIINPSCKQDAAFAASAEFGAAIALQGRGAIIGAPYTRNGVGAWYYLRIS